ncbi:MAG: hypothetical protein AVDCRST_MAG35-690, partial [uncultured Quadrisphaera sp.]
DPLRARPHRRRGAPARRAVHPAGRGPDRGQRDERHHHVDGARPADRRGGRPAGRARAARRAPGPPAL